MSRSRVSILVGVVLLLTLLLHPSANSQVSPEHYVECASPAAWNYASIDWYDSSTYRIAGSGACESTVDWIDIDCWPVHRHSFSWHSHDVNTIGDRNYSAARVTVGWSGLIGGTKDDDYKTHCEMSARHGTTTTWSRESRVINL